MSKIQEPITVDQHYVPRFYMKNFSLVKGTGKKEKVFISFFQFDEKLYREHIPTKTICYENYFYGEDGEIEKEFANREKVWARIINDIIETKNFDLDDDNIRKLKQFAIYQYHRTLASYKYGTRMMSEILSQPIINNNPELDENIIKSMVNKKVEEEISVADIISCCDEEVDIIEDLDLAIVKNDTAKKFITSDMPVIVINPFCIQKAGIANVGIVIMFPISPELLVLIYDGKIYKNCKNGMAIVDENEIEKINMYQVISAEERILSKNINELELYVKNLELVVKRNEFQAERKVNTSYDGKGTFIAAKSRSIRYLYDVSLFKLPKCLYKIPKECRTAVTREYSYDFRINLLVRAYKLPEWLKEKAEFSIKDIVERKEGNSKFQKFMDDYWEIPKSQRIITPELMHKIKTVQTSFFPIDS